MAVTGTITEYFEDLHFMSAEINWESVETNFDLLSAQEKDFHYVSDNPRDEQNLPSIVSKADCSSLDPAEMASNSRGTSADWKN